MLFRSEQSTTSHAPVSGQEREKPYFDLPLRVWLFPLFYLLGMALTGLRFYPALLLLILSWIWSLKNDRYHLIIQLTLFFGGNYIIRIGLNMASKKYRTISRTDSLDEVDAEESEKLSSRARRIQRVTDLLKELPTHEEPELYKDPEAQALLGDELTHTPEPCASIIRKTYFSGMSDAEIAEEVSPYRDNGKPLSDNAKAIKARRWLCMRDLV